MRPSSITQPGSAADSDQYARRRRWAWPVRESDRRCRRFCAQAGIDRGAGPEPGRSHRRALVRAARRGEIRRERRGIRSTASWFSKATSIPIAAGSEHRHQLRRAARYVSRAFRWPISKRPPKAGKMDQLRKWVNGKIVLVGTDSLRRPPRHAVFHALQRDQMAHAGRRDPRQHGAHAARREVIWCPRRNGRWCWRCCWPPALRCGSPPRWPPGARWRSCCSKLPRFWWPLTCCSKAVSFCRPPKCCWRPPSA